MSQRPSPSSHLKPQISTGLHDPYDQELLKSYGKIQSDASEDDYEKIQKKILVGKEFSLVELVKFYLQKIEKYNPSLNAFITVDPEYALKQALFWDNKIAKTLKDGGSPLDQYPLLAVLVGIKDQICTKNLRTTAASRMLANFVPPYNATAVEQLQGKGAIILGKTNQDEFAMGSSNESSAFGAVKNPWNTLHVPGGSSGGSAVAIATGLCTGALGTDTGGSIRQPASFCGIVGIKPTYGRVSRFGVIGYASSLDQVGVFSKGVKNAGKLLESICGFDPKDPTTISKPFSASNSDPLPPLGQVASQLPVRVGFFEEHQNYRKTSGTLCHPDHAKTLDLALTRLEEKGAQIIPLNMPLLEYAVSVYYIIATSEASSNLARYDGVRYGYRSPFESLQKMDLATFYAKNRGESFGLEVKKRILMGTFCLRSGYYDEYFQKAAKVRSLICQDFSRIFYEDPKVDFLITPVTTTPPPLLKTKKKNNEKGQEDSSSLEAYLKDALTVTANLAGLPSLSLPFGRTEYYDLPIGVQIIAPPCKEQALLSLAYQLEQTPEGQNEKRRIPHGFEFEI